MKSMVCRLVGHKRSRRDARRINACWISYCRWCGSLMIREAPRQWATVTFVNGMPAGHGEEANGG